MKKLAELVNHVVMNRITLAGYNLSATGLAGLMYGLTNNDKTIVNCSIGPLYTGVSFLLATRFGIDTYRSYKKAKEHIQKHKRLDEKIVNLNARLYCDRQGVYIAAKELGYMDDYKKAMEGKRVIIPNF